MQKTIFVVDDNITNLALAKDALKDYYNVVTMPSAVKMFKMLEKRIPELILLDIEMPEMDGFEALVRLKAQENLASILVIFLTSMTDEAIEVRGFQLGAIDFITKPFSAHILQNRLKTHLDIDQLIRERTEQLHQKTIKLQALQNGIVSVLADMVESRDKGTGGHVERTSIYLHLLINEMIKKNIYCDELKNLDLDIFVLSARLHDVGKIAISDLILNKPDKLTETEFALMRTHCEQGEEIVKKIAERADDAEFLRSAQLFAGTHHERWDGKGYPCGLAGEDIPFHGRIMALVDVFDALVSERPYKRAIDPEIAAEIIMENSGVQFDPCIAKVFYEAREKFFEVAKKTSNLNINNLGDDING